jgi:hypothetical protein
MEEEGPVSERAAQATFVACNPTTRGGSARFSKTAGLEE